MPDDLSLLLNIKKGENAAPQMAADARTAISGLRSHYATEMQNLNTVTQNVFGELEKHLNLFAGERLPLVGGAFLKVTENLKDLGAEAEKTGGAFAEMAGPIGIAVVGIAATAAAAVELTKSLYEVSESTAAWEEKLYDLSKQTGVSVETLNALQIEAERTGGNIESITASLGIFQKHLEEADDPASKIGKKIHDLGIETTNTEDALRQTLRILASMPEGFEQTGLALELFGRSGKQILAILKETGGNIDEVVAKLGPLAQVTTENAEQAHEYDEAMKNLSLAARGFTAIIGREALPAFTEMLKSLNDNQEAVIAVAEVLGKLTVLITGPLEGALNVLGAGVKSIELAWLGAYRAILLYQGVAASAVFASEAAGDSGLFAGASARIGSSSAIRGLTGGVAGIAPDTGGGRAARAEKLSAGQKLLNQLQDEYNKLIEKAGDLDSYDKTVLELKKKAYQDLTDEPGGLKDQILQQASLNRLEEEIIKEKKDRADFEKELNKEEIDQAKELIDILQRRADARTQIEGRVTEALQEQYKTLSELKGFEVSHLQIVEEFIAKQVQEAEAVGGVTDKMKEYFALLLKVAAKEDEIVAHSKLFEGVQGEAGGATPRGFGLSEIQKLQLAINDRFGEGTTKAQGFTAALEGIAVAAQSVGQAVGNVVQSFVLLGTAGTSFRKFAAEVLASVAAMAAGKAVFELAEGFAALARAFFGDPKAAAEAVLHFKAAAIYGAVAGVAAIAGREVAGTSFAQQGSSSGTGGGGASGGTSSGSSSQNAPINLGSQRGPGVIHLVVHHEFQSGAPFRSQVVSAWAQDFQGGGTSRQVTIKEINRQS